MNNPLVIRTGIVLGAGALVLAGCAQQGTDTAAPEATVTVTEQPAGGDAAASPEATDSPAAAEGSASPGAAGSGDTTTAAAAIDTALGAVDNGIVYDIDRDTDDGNTVWDIRVASGGTEHEVVVSEDGSQVVEQESGDSDDDAREAEQADVDAKTALQTAVDAQGGTLDEMELDTPFGSDVLQWEIKLDQEDGSRTTVNVDASSGEIIQ